MEGLPLEIGLIRTLFKHDRSTHSLSLPLVLETSMELLHFSDVPSTSRVL